MSLYCPWCNVAINFRMVENLFQSFKSCLRFCGCQCQCLVKWLYLQKNSALQEKSTWTNIEIRRQNNENQDFRTCVKMQYRNDAPTNSRIDTDQQPERIFLSNNETEWNLVRLLTVRVDNGGFVIQCIQCSVKLICSLQ